jgi:hypothetical protein
VNEPSNLPAAAAPTTTAVLVRHVGVPLLFIAVGILVGKFVLTRKESK